MTNPFNWKEITRKSIWGFATAFIYITIFAVKYISGFAELDRELIDAGGLALNLTVFMIIYIGYPILISVFLVKRNLRVFIKVTLFFALLVIFSMLVSVYTRYENSSAVVALIVFLFIPVFHLLRYEQANILKYFLGLATGVLSLILVIPFAVLSSLILVFLFSPIIFTKMANAAWIASSAGLTVALYWFLIGIEEELYARRASKIKIKS